MSRHTFISIMYINICFLQCMPTWIPMGTETPTISASWHFSYGEEENQGRLRLLWEDVENALWNGVQAPHKMALFAGVSFSMGLASAPLRRAFPGSFSLFLFGLSLGIVLKIACVAQWQFFILICDVTTVEIPLWAAQMLRNFWIYCCHEIFYEFA